MNIINLDTISVRRDSKNTYDMRIEDRCKCNPGMITTVQTCLFNLIYIILNMNSGFAIISEIDLKLY